MCDCGGDPNLGRVPPPFASWLDGPASVTTAELLALQYISHGCTKKMVAAALGKDYETVATQLQAARYRLRAKNTTHAACEAIRLGLIP